MSMKSNSIIEDQFRKFYENIKLTETQREDAKTKYEGVCKKLHDHFYSKKYDGTTKLLIGSYGKDTMIRPARDVDVIFKMPFEKYKEYDDNKTNSQSQLLQDIKKILEEKYPDTPIKANEKIVAVQFADGTHDVEVVPAWELKNGSFRIPNSANGGSWEDYDYRKDIQKIKDSESKTGQTKFLIRAIKKWYDNCSVQVKTFEIEKTVLSFFASNTVSQNRALLIKNFFEYFLNNTYDDKTKSHITTAINRAKKAVEFETHEEYEKAIDEWIKIFGNDFPKTINKTDNSIDELRKAYPSSREQFLDKDFNIPFRIDSRYSVKIDADVEQDGFRKKTLTEYILDKLPLRKRKSLSFKIISCKCSLSVSNKMES